MPRNNVSVSVDTSVLDRLIKQMPGEVSKNIRAIAFGIEGKAKLKAPVDTGALRASIYTRIGNEDSFGAVASDVHSRNREAEMVQLPKPESNLVAYIGPSVNYGIDVELGTRRRAATPYLTPAVREAERELSAAMGKAIKDAAK